MKCKGCAYSGILDGEIYCNYLQLAGRRRPCPPGEDCTVRKARKRVRRPAWHERALELYRRRMPDGVIAAEVGVNESTVRRWRKRMELPAVMGENRESRPG